MNSFELIHSNESNFPIQCPALMHMHYWNILMYLWIIFTFEGNHKENTHTQKYWLRKPIMCLWLISKGQVKVAKVKGQNKRVFLVSAAIFIMLHRHNIIMFMCTCLYHMCVHLFSQQTNGNISNPLLFTNFP